MFTAIHLYLDDCLIYLFFFFQINNLRKGTAVYCRQIIGWDLHLGDIHYDPWNQCDTNIYKISLMVWKFNTTVIWKVLFHSE